MNQLKILVAFVLLLLSYVPIMLLLAMTCYPIMVSYPEMTTIIVKTKITFWYCIGSMICSFSILAMLIKKEFSK
jgi:hypothetical protein